MRKTLKDYFPIIRTREEVKSVINSNSSLKEMFELWQEQDKRAFLDMCTGARGVKMLYDSFFKEIMNPEYAPERLNDFLSLLLNQQVRLKELLPGDSSRLADENSLLIMDILVELEDGTLANMEVQKIGHKFPGERSACYSADLLLRQYKRIRDEKKRLKKQFSYKDIQDVYVIVLFEKSPDEFWEVPDIYSHYVSYQPGTGVNIRMPQKFIFISLDIFKEKQDNEDVTIHNRLEAWLTFLCRDETEKIMELINQYPEFKPMYENVYDLCRNMEKIMGMFSRELLEMDRNNVKFMIDELQEDVDKLQKERDEITRERDEITRERDEAARERDEITKERDEAAQVVNELLKERDEKAREVDKQIAAKDRRIAELEKLLAER